MINRFIFTVTAGRTGTKYLQRLLINCDGVVAEHEAHPTPNVLLRRMNLGMPWPHLLKSWTWMKALHLAGVEEERDRCHPKANLQPLSVYADTSHVLCKSVLHPGRPLLLDALQSVVPGCRIDLIHLTRDTRKTAESLLSIGMSPSLWPNPLSYGLTPDHPFSEPWDGWLDLAKMDQAHDDQYLPGRLALILWYLRQIDVIAERAEGTGYAVHRVDISDLNDFAACEVFAHRLGLTLTGHARNVIGRPANTAEARGMKRKTVTDAQWAEARRISEDRPR